MAITWSYAASGLTIAVVGLAVGQTMVPRLDTPNVFRSKGGQILFGLLGLVLTALCLYFLFRLFSDNGWWGLLQLFIVSLVCGLITRMQWTQNVLVPIVCAVLGCVQAYRIW